MPADAERRSPAGIHTRCSARLVELGGWLLALWIVQPLAALAQPHITPVFDYYRLNITWQDKTGNGCFTYTNYIFTTNTGNSLAMVLPVPVVFSCGIIGDGGTCAGTFVGQITANFPATAPMGIINAANTNRFDLDAPFSFSFGLQGAWNAGCTTSSLPNANLSGSAFPYPGLGGMNCSSAMVKFGPPCPSNSYPVMLNSTCVATNLWSGGTDGSNLLYGTAVELATSLDANLGAGGLIVVGNIIITPIYRLGNQPDLAVTSLEWNSTADAGLDLVYTNMGNALDVSASAKLFWANGPNLANAFTDNPIWGAVIPKGFTGMSSNHLAESLFSSPPSGATYVVLALDPENLTTDTNKANNVMALRNTFRHVVLVMMENRSFDHYLGWLPGADGKQAGLTYFNNAGQGFPTWGLAPHFQGCSCDLPDQLFGARIEFNNGACDGWLKANTNGTFTIGYYTQKDLAFFGQIAPAWTVCDRYFSAVMAETQPNRIYQHAAQTSILTNLPGYVPVYNPLTLPTIWDRLSQSNIFARYYYAGLYEAGSVLSLWRLQYNSINYQILQFYEDCANGALPAVSYVDPDFTSVRDAAHQGDTTGNDNHPHSDIRNGEAFLAGIYNAIVSSPTWASTVMIINFDEWGGFYDHVTPPVVPIEPAEQALGNDGRLGFRVPCIVISPWSHHGIVSHEQFDHCSVLKLIENRWQLRPLTVRDTNAKDLADVLDLDHPDFDRPPPLTDVPGTIESIGGDRLFGFPCQTLQAVLQPDGSLMLSWDDTCPRVLTIQRTDGIIFPSWTDVAAVYKSPLVLPPAQHGGFYRYKFK
jgi:phospholipase C